jgi:hypothetical protein
MWKYTENLQSLYETIGWTERDRITPGRAETAASVINKAERQAEVY